MIREASVSRDPSRRSGNTRGRKLVVVATTAAAMMLASCSDTNPQDATVGIPTSTVAPEIATPREVMLNGEVQKQKDEFAQKILALTQETDPRFRTVTTPQPSDVSKGITAVEVTSGSLFGNDEAHYTMYVSGDLDPQTQHVDPAKATSVFIGMDLEKGHPKAGHFYGYMLNKVVDSDNWEVFYAAENKGGGVDRANYATGQVGPNSTVAYELLNSERFAQLTQQAEAVLGWAQEAAPINYAPTIS